MAASEALVRAVRPQILERYPEGFYVESASRQYRLRPGFDGEFRYPEFRTRVRINSQGLREERLLGPAGPRTRRIIAVGDSFTLGYSVEEKQTWVRRLEALLRARDPAWEVINAGVPGYSTWQELSYLEEEGEKLKPEAVLLGFFIGNDIVDNAEPRLPVDLREGRLVAANLEAGLLPFGFRLALARHSHLFRVAWPVWRSWRGDAGQRRGRHAVYTGGIEAGWRATGELLGRLSRWSAARGIRTIVVLIPERTQADPEARRRLAVELGRCPERFDPGLPSYRMREMCRAAGLETVDLLEAVSGPGLYFPQDGHWTVRGNEMAAQALAAYLAP